MEKKDSDMKVSLLNHLLETLGEMKRSDSAEKVKGHLAKKKPAGVLVIEEETSPVVEMSHDEPDGDEAPEEPRDLKKLLAEKMSKAKFGSNR